MIRAFASISQRSGARSFLPWAGKLSRRAAFTLVEVVIAVGLVGFVLTAILGLAMMAINETKNADLKARLAWITESVTSECQGQRFATVLGSLSDPAAWPKYWDFSGKPVDASSRDVHYFRADLKNVTPASTESLTTNNFALIQVSISWPEPTPTSTNVFLISLFNYQ